MATTSEYRPGTRCQLHRDFMAVCTDPHCHKKTLVGAGRTIIPSGRDQDNQLTALLKCPHCRLGQCLITLAWGYDSEGV